MSSDVKCRCKCCSWKQTRLHNSLLKYISSNPAEYDFIPVQVDDLQIIVTNWRIPYGEKALFEPFPDLSYDHVLSNLVIGDQFIATNLYKLRALKITHILNMSETESKPGDITNASFYKELKIPVEYLGIVAEDEPEFQLYDFFWKAAAFIHKGLKLKKGKVLVHSEHGMSRSATITIAYLMLCKKYSLVEAVRLLRNRRNVSPNHGFLQQLCILDCLLRINKRQGKADPFPTEDQPASQESKDELVENKPTPVITIPSELPLITETTTPVDVPCSEEPPKPKVVPEKKKPLTQAQREQKRKVMSNLAAALRKTAAEMEEAETKAATVEKEEKISAD